MIERRQDLRFALEAGEPVEVERKELRQDLQRDITIELRVACAIHLAHAACAERTTYFVRAESSAVA
jgi:hypothetical protein